MSESRVDSAGKGGVKKPAESDEEDAEDGEDEGENDASSDAGSKAGGKETVNQLMGAGRTASVKRGVGAEFILPQVVRERVGRARGACVHQHVRVYTRTLTLHTY